MRRQLAVGAFVVLIVSALALTHGELQKVFAAASNTESVIGLGLVTPSSRGCQLGPAYGFCEQVPGTTGSTVQFTIHFVAAASSVAVSVASIAGLSANFASGDFTISSNTCSGNFSAPQTCSFAVAFSPTTTGLRQSAINVTDAAGDTLAINVQGIGSQLALAPPPVITTCGVATQFGNNAYTYCPEAVGAVSAVQQFTLASGSGATGVNVALAAVPGLESEFAAADFTVENTTCTGALPANGNCAIGVAFTPSIAGMRSAALTATDSNGDKTTIYLAGTSTSGITFAGSTSGFALTHPAPCAQLNFFDFCNLPVGGVSLQTNSFTLQNGGTQITGLTVPKGSVIAQGATAPDFTVQSSSCSSVLAAGASCNITVAFTPTTTGLRQGAIVITDAQGDVATVNLAGYGDDYSIAAQLPTEQSVIPGNSVTFNATLTPDSVFGMNGEQVTFVCPTDLPANTSCATTPCPAAITPGTPVAVKVAFATSSANAVVPVPTGGCSSYGPAVSPSSVAPLLKPSFPPAAGGSARSSPIYPAVFVLAGFGAIGLLIFGFSGLSANGPRKRATLIIMCAGLAAAILAGCHHHGAVTTTATPNTETALTVFGNALDGNGNSLNASRQFQITLDVVTK